VRRLPDGKAQAYIRDPGGNRVEINAADASELDMAVVGDLTDISGPAGAELYL
jgi:YD repeat-containing protein